MRNKLKLALLSLSALSLLASCGGGGSNPSSSSEVTSEPVVSSELSSESSKESSKEPISIVEESSEEPLIIESSEETPVVSSEVASSIPAPLVTSEAPLPVETSEEIIPVGTSEEQHEVTTEVHPVTTSEEPLPVESSGEAPVFSSEELIESSEELPVESSEEVVPVLSSEEPLPVESSEEPLPIESSEEIIESSEELSIESSEEPLPVESSEEPLPIESSEELIESSEEPLPDFYTIKQLAKSGREDFVGGHIILSDYLERIRVILDDGETMVTFVVASNQVEGLEKDIQYPALLKGKVSASTYDSTAPVFTPNMTTLRLVEEEDVPGVSYEVMEGQTSNPNYEAMSGSYEYYRPFKYVGFKLQNEFCFEEGALGPHSTMADQCLGYDTTSSYDAFKEKPLNSAIILTGYARFNRNAGNWGTKVYYTFIDCVYDPDYKVEKLGVTDEKGLSVIDEPIVGKNFYLDYVCELSEDSKKNDALLPTLTWDWNEIGGVNASFVEVDGVKKIKASVSYFNGGGDLNFYLSFQGLTTKFTFTNPKKAPDYYYLSYNGESVHGKTINMSLGQSIEFDVNMVPEDAVDVGYRLAEYNGCLAIDGNKITAIKSGDTTLNCYLAEGYSGGYISDVKIKISGAIDYSKAYTISSLVEEGVEGEKIVPVQGLVVANGDEIRLYDPTNLDNYIVAPTSTFKYRNGTYISDYMFKYEVGTGLYPDNSYFADYPLSNYVGRILDLYLVVKGGETLEVEYMTATKTVTNYDTSVNRTIKTNCETLGITEQTLAYSSSTTSLGSSVTVTITAAEGYPEKVTYKGYFDDEAKELELTKISDYKYQFKYTASLKDALEITYAKRSFKLNTVTLTKDSGFKLRGYRYDHDSVDSYTVGGLNVSSWGVSNTDNSILFYNEKENRTAFLNINLPAGAFLKSFDVDWSLSDSNEITFSASSTSGSMQVANSNYVTLDEGKVFALNGGTSLATSDTYLRLQTWAYAEYNQSFKTYVTRILINYLTIEE